MKKTIAWILIAFLIAILVIGILYVLNMKKTTTPTQTGTSFPISGTGTTNTGGNTTTPAAGFTSLTTQNGTKIAALDFIHNGTTIEDPANKGTYYLAGSSGACKPDGTCPKAGTETDYTILYYTSDGSFNIGLANEPLGVVRQEAEQYLMKTLGLTQNQMCNLKYSIGTTSYVNEQYGGENLGFSFCPGAVQLPQ